VPWPVLVLGEGSAAGRVRAAEVEAALARASIFALPARYEPFGLSALEAALARCALVLGDIASLREIWDDAALFVDPADDAKLRRALLALIADETRRNHLAEAALARAQVYTPSLMADRYLDLYERLAAATLEPERV
jgi:glycosyltransferase involved in cell wall biosynthesis